MKTTKKMTSAQRKSAAVVIIILTVALGYVLSVRLAPLNQDIRQKKDVSQILQRTVRDKLMLALRLKDLQCTAYLNDAMQALECLAGSSKLADALAASHGDRELFPSEDLLEHCWTALYVLDNQGKVLIYTGNEAESGNSSGKNPEFEAWKQVLADGETAFIDIAPDKGAGKDTPAGCILAAPIRVAGELRGVIAARLDLRTLNAIINDSTGLGASGQSYLLGPDLIPRTTSPVTSPEHSADIELSPTPLPQARNALQGTSGIMESTNSEGQKVIAAYCPLSFSKTKWLVLVEINYQEALASLEAASDALQQLLHPDFPWKVL